MSSEKDSIEFDITSKKLLYDNILVRLVELKKGNGIIIDPEQYSDKPEVGEVISVGNGRFADNGETIPLIVKVGDIVLFNKYSSVKYRNPLTREDLYVIREEDVVCH